MRTKVRRSFLARLLEELLAAEERYAAARAQLTDADLAALATYRPGTRPASANLALLHHAAMVRRNAHELAAQYGYKHPLRSPSNPATEQLK